MNNSITTFKIMYTYFENILKPAFIKEIQELSALASNMKNYVIGL